MNVKDWVVIITGSSSGIGAASARLLAKHGARVVINYSRSVDAAKQVQAECEADGGETLLVKADIASDADCRAMAKAAVDKWGRIDGLVNNAGTTKFAAHTDLEALSGDDFAKIMAVNVTGTYQMTRAVVPAMRANGFGAVVNVSSIAGIMGVGSSIAYAASKGAINTMTLALAKALGPEIRVNTLCPGFVQGRWLREGMGEELYDAVKRGLETNAPLRRAGTAEDMAQAIHFLLAGNRNMTGEIMVCDAGVHLSAAALQPR
jgi:3-oxoacyl-[acyl-carrier protein] reductase